MKEVETFLKEQQIRAADVDIQNLVEVFTSEMVQGLEGKDSTLRMIPTYIEADNEFITDVPVVAIDAGGTNFRAAKVKFTKEGRLEITDTVNAKMPGLKKEVTKEAFFHEMAENIKPLVTDCERIGFCFSYATEIYPNKDGKLLQFSKEVKAPEVVGQMIGKSLLEALGMPDKQIVLLNDTVATLLAGKSASFEKEYDSFIGFILGTGTNTCYIEKNRNILKKPDLDPEKSQIINVESGNFGKAPRTPVDIAFDNTTDNPGSYSFEKMFSGGYIGSLSLATLKTAAKEGVFSPETAQKISALNELTTEDVNKYVTREASDRGSFPEYMTNNTDDEKGVEIVECLIDRAAKLVAGNLASVVLKTNKGKSPDKPILITIEGTTFYKMHNLKSSFEKYFKEYLSGERARYYEFTEVEQSSLVGAALAALVE